MYLIIPQDNMTASQARWLNTNALRIGKSNWIHSSYVPNTTALTLDSGALREMRLEINDASSEFLARIEGKLITSSGGHITGKSLRISTNKLKLILEASFCMDVVALAKDLLTILSDWEDIEPEKFIPETPLSSDTSLGVDGSSVENYILGLAKSKTIH